MRLVIPDWPVNLPVSALVKYPCYTFTVCAASCMKHLFSKNKVMGWKRKEEDSKEGSRWARSEKVKNKVKLVIMKVNKWFMEEAGKKVN